MLIADADREETVGKEECRARELPAARRPYAAARKGNADERPGRNEERYCVDDLRARPARRGRGRRRHFRPWFHAMDDSTENQSATRAACGDATQFTGRARRRADLPRARKIGRAHV